MNLLIEEWCYSLDEWSHFFGKWRDAEDGTDDGDEDEDGEEDDCFKLSACGDSHEGGQGYIVPTLAVEFEGPEHWDTHFCNHVTEKVDDDATGCGDAEPPVAFVFGEVAGYEDGGGEGCNHDEVGAVGFSGFFDLLFKESC